MKLYLLCLTVCFLQGLSPVLSAASKVSDEDAIAACKSELSLPDHVYASFEKIQALSSSNQNYNTFLSCTWKKLGLQDGDGKINFPNLIKYLTDFCEKRAAEVFTVVPDERAVTGWLDKCRDLHGTTHGEAAAKVHFCLSEGIDDFRVKHKKQH